MALLEWEDAQNAALGFGTLKYPIISPRGGWCPCISPLVPLPAPTNTSLLLNTHSLFQTGATWKPERFQNTPNASQHIKKA